MICDYVWNGETGSPRRHFWSIPANPERDFDCIFADAIAELEDRRVAMKEAGLKLPQWGD